MIPRIVHDGNATFEVFGFIANEAPNEYYAAGIATVTQPGTGRLATLRTVTHNGLDWYAEPGTFETGYAGMRDAQRHMWQRTGMDNHAIVTSAQGLPAGHPSSFWDKLRNR